MVCILGRWGRISLIECLLRLNPLQGIDLLAGYDVLIVPGEYNDMVTVSFRDFYKKDLQISRELFGRYLHEGKGFTIEEIAYVTVTGGTMLDFEICVPFCYSDYDINGFLKSADAIIILCEAAHMGMEYERREIEKLFSYRKLKNLFFLVRGFGILKEEDKGEFFDRLENHLGSVFVDEKGKFQQELYERRVFLVDLALAEAARLGGTLQYGKGGEWIRRKVNRLEDSLSGFQSFETALKTFLRTQKWNKIGKY